MEKTQRLVRAKGRSPSGLDTAQYTVMLEADTAEWAKKQPGGLSEMLRRLLREAKTQIEEKRSNDSH